jgi:hypothetical protein
MCPSSLTKSPGFAKIFSLTAIYRSKLVKWQVMVRVQRPCQSCPGLPMQEIKDTVKGKFQEIKVYTNKSWGKSRQGGNWEEQSVGDFSQGF